METAKPPPNAVAPNGQEPEFPPDNDIFEEPPFDPGFEVFDTPPINVAPIAPTREVRSDPSKMPVRRLPPPTADELAHFDDKNLDAYYEFKLQVTGDDLLPIRQKSEIIKALLDEETVIPRQIPRPATAPKIAAAVAGLVALTDSSTRSCQGNSVATCSVTGTGPAEKRIEPPV